MMPCPMFSDPACRFCSHEHLLVPYAPLVENPKTLRLEPGNTLQRKEFLGEFCNNISEWVSKLKYCPARWGLYGVPTTGIRADGTGVYADSQELPISIIYGQQVLEI